MRFGVQFVETDSRKMVVARGWWRGDGASLFNGYRISDLQNEKCSGDGVVDAQRA